MRVSNWLRPLAARLSPTRARWTRRRPAFRPRVQALEDRTVPTVFTVNTVADTPAVDLVTGQDSAGNISLRSAIQAANAAPGADTINFAIPGALKSTAGNWWTIQLQAGLPTVTDTVAIDGAPTPGYAGPPLIEVHGLGGLPADGLDGLTFGMGSAGSSVRGLVLNNFGNTYYGSGNTAIHLTGPGATGIVIAGNYIGTDPTGTQPVWNGPGVLIDGGASGNTVGGTTAADRNVMGGNLQSAVWITGSGSQQNVVAGNYIGTDVNGLAAVPNAGLISGGVVRIDGGASDNLIGGSAPGAGNLISGNGGHPLFTNSALSGTGVGITGVGTDRNKVQGNLIGTDRCGNALLVNSHSGVFISGGARSNVIGTDGDGVNDGSEGNVISGNLGDGIDILGNGTDCNVVAGNIIGLGQDGSTPLGNNVGVGILGGATGNRIGTNADGVSDELERNIISSSRYDGVCIGNGDGTAGNIVAGNYIGTDKTGLLARGNAGHISGDPLIRGGVLCLGSGSNRIGGTTAVERNVISGNGYGVVIESLGRGTSGVQILGNYIGTDKTGAPVLGNGVGVYLLNGSTDNVIGGLAPGAGNLIAGNTRRGVLIQGDTSAGNAVSGNSIFANGGLGIDLGGDFLNGIDRGDGVTPNDALDADTGPNDLQNYPLVGSAARTAAGTAVSGTLNSTPGTQFRLEFFGSAALDTAGNVEGQTYLGFVNVTTDADGNATFNTTLAAAPAGQQYISATATRLDASGNPTDTSEFTPLPQSQVLPGTPPPASLSGVVWEDFNDDGQVDFGEKGIGGVTVTLTGTDFLGNAVNQSQLTDSDGAYVFLNLYPGNYYLTETQPAGYTQGIDSVGTAGGSLVATDQFFVHLDPGVNGLNYNFGEQPPAGGSIQKGQTAGIGFWNNKNGQALIKSLNGGTGTQLADWLAATLPNIFGANAGSNNLTGKSNADVAALFQSDFLLKGVKLDAQVLATALSVYATNATLDSTQVAAQYGFTVSGDGAGTATVNVGSNGDAFGVANNTTLTLMDLLLAADDQAVNGVLYGGNATKRNEANNIFSAVNQAGGL